MFLNTSENFGTCLLVSGDMFLFSVEGEILIFSRKSGASWTQKIKIVLFLQRENNILRMNISTIERSGGWKCFKQSHGWNSCPFLPATRILNHNYYSKFGALNQEFPSEWTFVTKLFWRCNGNISAQRRYEKVYFFKDEYFNWEIYVSGYIPICLLPRVLHL